MSRSLRRLAFLADMQWKPHLSPLRGGLRFLELAAWLSLVCRRMPTRMGKQRSLALLAPKVLLLLVLLVEWTLRRRGNLI